jgi:hypothetical protein
MSIQLQIEETPGYLAAKFTGSGATEEIWRQFELIAEACKRANKNKLLLDFVGAYADASLPKRYFMGEWAEIFARYKLIKVAVAVRPERLDPQRFGEMAMQNRGVNARVFISVEDAEEWLSE